MDCEHCGKKLGPSKQKKQKRYCNSKCQRASYIQSNVQVPRANRGAYGELLVCCDLMAKGYDVFRCVSPHSPFDLVAYDKSSHRTLRIEVKTGYMTKTGHITCGGKATVKHEHVDHIAISVEGQVVYEPPLSLGLMYQDEN